MQQLAWHVGDVVRKLREQRGWNQTRLAEKAGLNKGTIVRIEEHADGIKRESYEKAARALNVTMRDLYDLVPGGSVERAEKNELVRQ